MGEYIGRQCGKRRGLEEGIARMRPGYLGKVDRFMEFGNEKLKNAINLCLDVFFLEEQRNRGSFMVVDILGGGNDDRPPPPPPRHSLLHRCGEYLVQFPQLPAYERGLVEAVRLNFQRQYMARVEELDHGYDPLPYRYESPNMHRRGAVTCDLKSEVCESLNLPMYFSAYEATEKYLQRTQGALSELDRMDFRFLYEVVKKGTVQQLRAFYEKKREQAERIGLPYNPNCSRPNAWMGLDTTLHTIAFFGSVEMFVEIYDRMQFYAQQTKTPFDPNPIDGDGKSVWEIVTAKREEPFRSDMQTIIRKKLQEQPL